ncbi:hypothetical protein EMCRGX_G009733 [Ephydatia muelleri]
MSSLNMATFSLGMTFSSEAEKDAVKLRVDSARRILFPDEWVITDARHDSSANAYHSTVPCMAGSTRRIVGITTLSRPEHRVAQTREVACTEIVLPQVIARGLNVTEVAHDYQSTIKTYVESRDKTWSAELSDKARSTKVHLYWCMKNCASNPDILCNMIMNISQHFQCRDTFWMESFNHQLLTYLPKRIHFHTNTFKMWMNLAVMDRMESMWTVKAKNTKRMMIMMHEVVSIPNGENN